MPELFDIGCHKQIFEEEAWETLQTLFYIHVYLYTSHALPSNPNALQSHSQSCHPP